MQIKIMLNENKNATKINKLYNQKRMYGNKYHKFKPA